MVVRLSKLYGKDIYTDAGKYLGKVQDLILDFERGEVARIVMEPLQGADKEEAKRILKEKSVLYKNVRSVEDVVVVSASTGPMPPVDLGRE